MLKKYINNKKMNDIFISYNFEIQKQVKELNSNLQQLSYRIWYDKKNSNTEVLADKSLDEIANSKLFLCCLTQSYCESDECIKEINHANILHKPIIILIIQNLNPEILYEFNKEILTELTYLSCFDSINWSNDHFIKIRDQIRKILEVY